MNSCEKTEFVESSSLPNDGKRGGRVSFGKQNDGVSEVVRVSRPPELQRREMGRGKRM